MTAMRRSVRRNVNVPKRTRAQGETLIIECGDCGEEASPSSRACLLCAVESLAGQHAAESVLMRRDVDRAVRGDAVMVLKELSLVLGALSFPEPPRQRSCSGCPSSPGELLRRARAAFPDLPPEPPAPERRRRRCTRCLAASSAALERARGLHRSAADLAQSLAFGETG